MGQADTQDNAAPLPESQAQSDAPAELAVDQRWEGDGFQFQLTQRWAHKGGWRVSLLLHGHLNYHDAYFIPDADIRRCRFMGMAPPDERSPVSAPLPPSFTVRKEYSLLDGGILVFCGAMVTFIMLMIVSAVTRTPLLTMVRGAPVMKPPTAIVVDGQRYRCVPVEGE